MSRGIEFNMDQTNKSNLCRIFKCVDVERYHWYCIQNQNESWIRDEDKEYPIFLPMEYYKGDDFKKEIQKDYLIKSLKLEAYKTTTSIVDIADYYTFKNSGCSLLLLVYDCENYELYINDPELLEIFKRQEKENGMLNVKEIPENNYGRTTFYV